jgi:hypothetical protein
MLFPGHFTYDFTHNNKLGMQGGLFVNHKGRDWWERSPNRMFGWLKKAAWPGRRHAKQPSEPGCVRKRISILVSPRPGRARCKACAQMARSERAAVAIRYNLEPNNFTHESLSKKKNHSRTWLRRSNQPDALDLHVLSMVPVSLAGGCERARLSLWPNQSRP